MSQSPTKELDHQGSFHSPEAALQNYPGGAMSERPLGSERCHTTLIHTHKWVARNCFPTPVKLAPRCPPQLKLIGKPGASWALLAEQGVAPAEVWSLPHFCFPNFTQVHLIGQPNSCIWSLAGRDLGDVVLALHLLQGRWPRQEEGRMYVGNQSLISVCSVISRKGP